MTSRPPSGGEPEHMRLAIAQARRNLAAEPAGGPFGACLVRDGRVLAAARNTVLATDATGHAEVNAIRSASARIGSHDLSGAVIYSTTEPCPMCFSAIHWARVAAIYYGTAIADVAALGFNEMPLSNARLARLGKSPVRLHPGFLREECLALLRDWERLPGKIIY